MLKTFLSFVELGNTCSFNVVSSYYFVALLHRIGWTVGIGTVSSLMGGLWVIVTSRMKWEGGGV